METIQEKYERDREVWNRCAVTYEKRIVGGHPDIVAFEEFEEEFLDHALRHLALTQKRPIRLLDIGCGSGRLHLRYGAKTSNLDDHPQAEALARLKENQRCCLFDPLLAERIEEVWGIDFSSRMIGLAKERLLRCGVAGAARIKLELAEGSAFDLDPLESEALPVAVCLVNSIGVMQGKEGATELFRSMRRLVERSDGIAFISCFLKEHLADYGLNQYESTLDVSGQPEWMSPRDYAGTDYLQVSRSYKRAFSFDPTLAVDVFDSRGTLVEEGHLLKRDPERTAETLRTGRIRTSWNYESNWYGFEELDEWTRALWGAESLHLRSAKLDTLRALPAQMAVLDCKGNLAALFDRLLSG